MPGIHVERIRKTIIYTKKKKKKIIAGHWGALRTILVIEPSIFCRRGFGLVVGVVVPSMLAVLPYAGRGFDSRSRLRKNNKTYTYETPSLGVILMTPVQAYI
jgi:hypothetical protein